MFGCHSSRVKRDPVTFVTYYKEGYYQPYIYFSKYQRRTIRVQKDALVEAENSPKHHIPGTRTDVTVRYPLRNSPKLTLRNRNHGTNHQHGRGQLGPGSLHMILVTEIKTINILLYQQFLNHHGGRVDINYQVLMILW